MEFPPFFSYRLRVLRPWRHPRRPYIANNTRHSHTPMLIHSPPPRTTKRRNYTKTIRFRGTRLKRKLSADAVRRSRVASVRSGDNSRVCVHGVTLVLWWGAVREGGRECQVGRMMVAWWVWDRRLGWGVVWTLVRVRMEGVCPHELRHLRDRYRLCRFWKNRLWRGRLSLVLRWSRKEWKLMLRRSSRNGERWVVTLDPVQHHLLVITVVASDTDSTDIQWRQCPSHQ